MPSVASPLPVALLQSGFRECICACGCVLSQCVVPLVFHSSVYVFLGLVLRSLKHNLFVSQNSAMRCRCFPGQAAGSCNTHARTCTCARTRTNTTHTHTYSPALHKSCQPAISPLGIEQCNFSHVTPPPTSPHEGPFPDWLFGFLSSFKKKKKLV